MLPLFFAQEKGIFKKYGLDPTIQVLAAGSTPLAALSSDQAQILFISAEGIAADLGGADFVSFLTLLPAPPLSILAKPEVKEVPDLRSRKIAVGSRNGSDENLAYFVLKKADVPVDDVEFVYTGSLANSLPALLSGAVDAAVISPPSSFQAEAKGFHELVNGPNSGWTYQSTSLWVTRAYASQNRAVLSSFAKAMIEAIATIRKDKATALDVLAKSANITDKALLEQTYGAIAPLFLKVPLAPVSAVRAALADFSRTIPAAATADPARFVDEGIVRELETAGFISQQYGN